MRRGFLVVADRVSPGECVVIKRFQTVDTQPTTVEKFDDGSDIGVTRAAISRIVVQNGAKAKNEEDSVVDESKEQKAEERDHMIMRVRKLREIELKEA